MLLLIGCLLLSGCATDKAYSVAKTGYKGGKVAVKALELNKDGKFDKVKKYAETYDEVRVTIRGEQPQKKSLVPTRLKTDL